MRHTRCTHDAHTRPILALRATHRIRRATPFTHPRSQVQTEKAKLLGKCVDSSDPARALQLAATLGVDVEKEARKAGLEI